MYAVYILKCRDGSLYTGIAKDLEDRLKKHNEGKASKYTRGRLPVSCVYSEKKRSLSAALKREIEIKSWERAKKMALTKRTGSP